MKLPIILPALVAAGLTLAGCAHAPQRTTIDDVTTEAAKILAIDDRPVDRVPLTTWVTEIPTAKVGAGPHELLVLRRGQGPGSRAETVQVPVQIDVHRHYRLDVVAGRVRVVPLPGER